MAKECMGHGIIRKFEGTHLLADTHPFKKVGRKRKTEATQVTPSPLFIPFRLFDPPVSGGERGYN